MNEQEENNTALSKDAQSLLNKLVADTCSKLKPEERVFSPKDASSYIYNLFNGDYKFSGKQYKELFNYLVECNSENKTGKCEHPYAFVYRKMDFERCDKCGKVLCEG